MRVKADQPDDLISPLSSGGTNNYPPAAEANSNHNLLRNRHVELKADDRACPDGHVV